MSDVLAHALSLLAPPLCAACAGPAAPSEVLCARCERGLIQVRPLSVLIPGIDEALAAAPYEGIARQLVGALKFRGRLSVATPMALAIAAAIELDAGAALVPVPPAPRRRRNRGFDPAEEIARALSELAGAPLLRCLRRADGPRQVGRARHERLVSPPRVRASGSVPAAVVLVDDVVTTGATLGACALALRTAGAISVRAVVFARSVGAFRSPRTSPVAALGGSADRA